MSFSHPILLVCLLAVPVAAARVPVVRAAPRPARGGLGACLAAAEHGRRGRRRWRRHLPIALLLLGAALLLVGFARPQTSIRVKRQDATVILVLDVSGSMAARDSQPTRLGAARAAAKRYVDKLPKGYRMALITFSDHTTLAAAADARPSRSSAPRSTARAPARRAPRSPMRSPARSRSGGRCPATKGKRPPAVIVVFSDGGQTAGRVTPAAGRQAGGERSHPRHDRRGRARRTGSCSSRSKAATPSASRCRCSRRRCRRSRRRAAGATSSGVAARRRQGDVRRARLARRPHAQDGRGDVGRGRRRPRVHARRRVRSRASGSGGSCEGRLVTASLAVFALAAATTSAGAATNECRGIMACIPVAGPWVLVPRARSGDLPARLPGRPQHRRRPRRAGELARGARLVRRPARCAGRPRRDDHALRALPRGLDLRSRRETFQPRLGCIPTQGGGGRSTVSARVTPVGPSLELRSRIVIIGPGQVRFAKVACLASEQLVGAWHATAFRVKKPPTARRRHARRRDAHRRRATGRRHCDCDRRAVDRLASGRAGRGGVRAVSFVWPWFLAVLARRPARAAVRAVARPAPREVRSRVHQPRRARLGRDDAAPAVALGAARAVLARARVRVGRARPSEGEGLRAVRPRDDRAARRRLGLDARRRRQADASRRRPGRDGHLRRQGPEGRKVGLVSFSSSADLLVIPTTDRTLLHEGVDLLVPEAGTAIGDGLGEAVQVARTALAGVAEGQGRQAARRRSSCSRTGRRRAAC